MKHHLLNTGNTRTKLACKSGFTLVETLIYVAIMGVISVSFSGFILSISNATTKGRVIKEVQNSGRLAVSVLSQKIRSAEGVNLGGSTFNTNPGVLSLAYDGSDQNPTVIQLTENNGQLVITEGTGPAVPVTSDEVNVTNLVFRNLTKNASRENIGIELTIEYDNSVDVIYQSVQSWQTAVSVRQ